MIAKRGAYSMHSGTLGLPFLDYVGPYVVADWGMSSWSGNQLADLVTVGQQVWGVTPGGGRVSDVNGADDPLFLDSKLMVFLGFNSTHASMHQHYWITLRKRREYL